MSHGARFALWVTLVFLVLDAGPAAEAALRARYCVPRFHAGLGIGNTQRTGTANAAAEFSSPAYIDTLSAGAWEGWEPRRGFEGASDDSWTRSRLVDGGFWIDSLFEPVTALGAFTGNLGPRLRGGEEPAAEGYIACFYGGLRFPSRGSFRLFAAGDDGGLRVRLDIDGDGNFDDSETREWPSVNPGDSGYPRIGHPRFEARNWKRMRYLDVPRAEPGRIYRFQARYFNHSGKSCAGLFWSRSGDSLAVPVPASAFGTRRNYGTPEPAWTEVRTSGGPVPARRWPLVRVSLGDTVTFKIQVPRIPGPPPRIVWGFGDGTSDTTTGPGVRHLYGRGLFTPWVSVDWGGRRSPPAANRIVLAVE